MSLAEIAGVLNGELKSCGVSAEHDIPALRDRLFVSEVPALRTLAGSLDPGLCADPAGYSWDNEEELLVHLRLEQTWTLAAFEENVDRIASSVAGADAGYCLGMVTDTLMTYTPSWLEGPAGGYAAEILARCVFGAAGAEVLMVSPDASSTTVAPLSGDLDVIRLLSATAGLGAVFLDTERFEIVDGDGNTIIAISAVALRHAREAPENVNDLATIAAFRESLLARGATGEDVALRLAASHAVLIGALGLRGLAEGVDRARVHRTVVERAGYSATFARSNPIKNKVMRRYVERLGRARAASAAATRDDAGADHRAIEQLAALANWGRSHGGAALPL
jgi:hypothetical protein